MGILARFKTLMASNWNALIERTDDPGKTIADIMRGLNSGLGQIRAEAAAVQAEERLAKQALDEFAAELAKLERYAEKSAQNGEPEAAARFLERRRQLTVKEAGLQAAYESASANAARLEQLRAKLESDMAKMEQRYTELKARMAEAQALRQGFDSTASQGKNEAAFKAMEEKADMAYFEAMAMAELRGEGKKDDLDFLLAQLDKTADNGAEKA